MVWNLVKRMQNMHARSWLARPSRPLHCLWHNRWLWLRSMSGGQGVHIKHGCIVVRVLCVFTCSGYWLASPGMATYMIQSLLKTADDSMEHNPDEFHASQIQYEQLVRTYWCCFAQDCELSSGARQHFALSFREISVPLPINDNAFNFGHRGVPRLMPADLTRDSSLCVKMTIDHGLTVVTRGFDIFVRILRFANESRRGRASSTTDSYSPQRTWQILKDELDEWRSLQDLTLHYPATSAQAHVALGYGELFAYINLIYFMRCVWSSLFLMVRKINLTKHSFPLSWPTPVRFKAEPPDFNQSERVRLVRRCHWTSFWDGTKHRSCPISPGGFRSSCHHTIFWVQRLCCSSCKHVRDGITVAISRWTRASRGREEGQFLIPRTSMRILARWS